MGRPRSFGKVGLFNTPTESRLVLADAFRRSMGVSRSTMHRYIKQYKFCPCWLGGRLFLQRQQLWEWESQVISGRFGSRPSVGNQAKEESKYEQTKNGN